MVARLALIAFALVVLSPAATAGTGPAAAHLCLEQMATARQLWQHDLYDAPPAVAAVMVDAIDGRLPQVRRGLAALPSDQQARWRQLAMLTAAWSHQPSVVEGLLDEGAAVDGKAWLPPVKPAFDRQALDATGRDPRFGGPATVKSLQSAGIVGNRGQQLGPALLAASGCNDVATLDVLLRHHADVMLRAPHSADALTVAVVNGEAGIARHLLDHGADVCADDRRIPRPDTTLAGIGRRKRLPDALVQRLTCPGPTAR